MEVQTTDAENAAFTVFVVLVTRVILAFDLNLYIPLSKVDDNMKRAHSRDGVHQHKASLTDLTPTRVLGRAACQRIRRVACSKQ